MKMHTTCFALATALTTMSSVDALAADRYAIAARLSHEGQTLAMPRLVVEEGSLASIETEGDQGYRLTVVATGLGNDRVKLVTTLRSRYGEMAPTITTWTGRKASISDGQVELEVEVHRVDI